MKKSVLSITVASLLMAGNAMADEASSAMAHVAITVSPNIAAGVLGATIDQSVQMGPFSAEIMFRVDANEEAVSLGVASSHLYKGDDPTLGEVAPLAVDQSGGVTIQPTHANPFSNGSNHASYSDPVVISTPKGDMDGFQSNSIAFESAQNGHFSQDVTVTTGWIQDDPEKPQGEYSGYVVLYTALLGATGG